MKKDIYRFWSRRKLKREIEILKITYNQLFESYQNMNTQFLEVIAERDKAKVGLTEEKIKNKRLQKENKRLEKEHQALYDCISKWYEPVNERGMSEIVEETRKCFESFSQIIY